MSFSASNCPNRLNVGELQTKNMLQIDVIMEKDLSCSENYQFVLNSAMLNLVLF